MIGGDVPDHDLDPPWIARDEDYEDERLRNIEDDIDRYYERRWETDMPAIDKEAGK